MSERTVIRSKKNERYKDLKQLGKKGPYQHCFPAEGVRLIDSVFSSGLKVEACIVAEAFITEQPVLFNRVTEHLDDAELIVLSADLFKDIADTVSPQGILLLVRKPQKADFSVLDGTIPKTVLVLDRVQDPGNVGTLIRMAAGIGIEACFAIEGTADPFESKTIRSAMGATMHLPLVIGLQIEEAYRWLHDRQFTIWAADMDGEVLDACPFEAPLALVLGNEGQGLSDAASQAADRIVSIPLSNDVESLNVAVAGSIIAYQIKRMVG